MRKKLEYLILRYGPTQLEFAKRIGTSQPSIAHWLKIGKIPATGMTKIITKLEDVTYEWLTDTKVQPTRPDTPVDASPSRSVPFYLACDDALFDGTPAGYIALPNSTAEFFVTSNTRSMLPSILPSDKVGLKKIKSFSHFRLGSTYIIHTTEDEFLLRRIKHFHKAQSILALTCSNNTEFADITIPLSSIKAIYIVTEVVHTVS